MDKVLLLYPGKACNLYILLTGWIQYHVNRSLVPFSTLSLNARGGYGAPREAQAINCLYRSTWRTFYGRSMLYVTEKLQSLQVDSESRPIYFRVYLRRLGRRQTTWRATWKVAHPDILSAGLPKVLFIYLEITGNKWWLFNIQSLIGCTGCQFWIFFCLTFLKKSYFCTHVTNKRK